MIFQYVTVAQIRSIKKEGTGFDLPIALGILATTGIIPQQIISRYLILGEPSLDGRVKAVRGSLPMALAAREVGCKAIMVPYDNGREASVVTVSKAANLGSKLSGAGKIQKLILDNCPLISCFERTKLLK